METILQVVHLEELQDYKEHTDKDFKGAIEKLGVVRTVLEKKCKYYKTFDKFITTLLNFSGRTYDHGADLKPAILDISDPYRKLVKKAPLKPKLQIAVMKRISNLATLDENEVKRIKRKLENECVIEQDAYDAIYEAELEVWKSDIKLFEQEESA